MKSINHTPKRSDIIKQIAHEQTISEQAARNVLTSMRGLPKKGFKLPKQKFDNQDNPPHPDKVKRR